MLIICALNLLVGVVQDFANMPIDEVRANINSRRDKIFLLMEELRRLRIQQRLKVRAAALLCVLRCCAGPINRTPEPAGQEQVHSQCSCYLTSLHHSSSRAPTHCYGSTDSSSDAGTGSTNGLPAVIFSRQSVEGGSPQGRGVASMHVEITEAFRLA